MKNRIYQVLCLAIALLFCVNTYGQEQNIPVKKQKEATAKTPHINQNQVEDAPPPPPQPEIKEEIFKVVEDMPRFPGCEGQGLDRSELRSCSNDLMFQYIKDNLVYPEEAKKKDIQGMTVIQFLIDKDGSILRPKIVRDLGVECEISCGQAALNIIKKMQSEIKWVAGKQRGRPVKVQYTMPIKFKL